MNLYNFNPYGTTMPYPQNQNIYGARQQVVRVNGKNGADTYQLPPNSSILLLDESAPIIWLKTTDGAGYATVAAYDIKEIFAQQEKKHAKYDSCICQLFKKKERG